MTNAVLTLYYQIEGSLVVPPGIVYSAGVETFILDTQCTEWQFAVCADNVTTKDPLKLWQRSSSSLTLHFQVIADILSDIRQGGGKPRYSCWRIIIITTLNPKYLDLNSPKLP